MACEVDPLDTPLELFRGDSAEYLFTFKEVAPVDGDPDVTFDLTTAVDGTTDRKAVVRFAVKSDPDIQTNVDALIYKESYRAADVAFLTQAGTTLGQCLVKVDKVDTEDSFPGVYRWDLEITRQDDERAGASQVGTATFAAGSRTVAGAGTAFQKAKRYDVLQPLGANAANPAIITKVISDTEIEVAHGEWLDAAAEAFEIRRGRTRTGMAGTFVLKSGVVSE